MTYENNPTPGTRFGKLTIIESADSRFLNSQWRRYYKVICDCGTIKEVGIAKLVSGNTKTCGQSGCRGHVGPLEASKRAIFRRYQYSAGKKKIPFTISLDQFTEITSRECHYCGNLPTNYALDPYGRQGLFVYNGLDRVNNKDGYEISNLVACCRICNIAKNDHSYNDFIDWIKQVYNHLYKDD